MTEPCVSSCHATAARAEDELGGVLGPGEVDERGGDVAAGRPRGTRRRAPRAAVRCSATQLRRPAPPGPSSAADVDAEQLAVGPLGDAGRPADQVLAARRAGERDDDPLARLPRLGDAVPLAVLLERVVDLVGDPQQRQLAQGGEVAGPEVVAERGVDLLGGVDVAVRHAAAQRLGRHVDELDLVGRPHDVVGDRLALADAGDALDDVVDRLEVLDVDRRDHVDAGVEQLLDVLPALLVAAAGHVGVRQLVDERDLGPAGEHGVDVHLLERRCPGSSSVRRGTTSRSPICSAVRARPWVSTNPTTTSVPRPLARRPSLSMANVLPTPGAAPR